MIHAVPLAKSTQMNRAAPTAPNTAPSPVSVTAPPAATDPPYTVNTAFIASIKPFSDDSRSGGRTSSTARIGIPYISSCPMPARAIATGMSRRGSTISSAAVEGSSIPTKEYSRIGTIAMNTPYEGLKSPAAIPWKPFWTPKMTADTVKNVSSTIWPIAPLDGSHLP